MSRRRVLYALVLLSALAAFAFPAAADCTALAVSSGATVDGMTAVTHTDDSGTDTFHVSLIPAADWEPGSTVQVWINTDDGGFTLAKTPLTSPGSIPQVAHTYAYFNASYPFQNEYQVGAGESTIGGSSKLRNSAAWFEKVELLRFAMQRATTAREAIQVIGSLAEKYGYLTSGEALPINDPNEAWLLEIYGPGPLWTPGSDRLGAVWVAQRVPNGEVTVDCNRSRIGEIDLTDTENFMASANIHSLAIELGLWDPASGKPFKVYETYGAKDYSPYNARREWRVLSLLAPSLNLSPWMERYPFSVKPDQLLTPQMIMAIERDHYEGTEFDLTKGLAAGPFGAPDRWGTSGGTGWERAISLHRTTYSTVVVARKNLPNWIGGLTWFGYDSPHTTCYMPLYCGVTALPASFDTGDRGGQYDVFSQTSAWWAFNFVENYSNLKYMYMIENIKAVRDPLEAEFFATQSAIEGAALALYATDPKLAQSFLTTYTNAVANRVVDAYWGLANQLVARYTDGYYYDETTWKATQHGYPAEWLEAVGFSDSTATPPEGLVPGIDHIEQP
jgi:dipeptidase